MKSIVIIGIVLCGVLAVQSNKAKIAEKWLKALQDCKVDEEASDDDLGPIIKRIQLAARKTKCLLACANEKMGYDMKDGSTNLDKIAERISEHYADAVQADAWNEVKAKCSQIKTADRCERASELSMCIGAEIIKKGLDPREFFL